MALKTEVEIGSLITRNPKLHHGRPIIAGTGISVQNIAILEKWGGTPEEIARNKYLTLAQVHAALAYYHANKDEIDATIVEDKADYDRLEAEWRQMRLEGRA